MLNINKTTIPELFSNEDYIKAKQRFLIDLENIGKPDFNIFNRFLVEIRELLIEESQNRCVYCEEKLGVTSKGQTSNYYPKSLYPKVAFDWGNLFLSCQFCNSSKGPFDPELDGERVILHPVLDNIEEELIENEFGMLIGKTKKAQNTIDLLNLNREPLVSQRLKNNLLAKLSKEGYSEASSIIGNDFYKNFDESISSLELLLTTEIGEKKQKQLLYNMIYANIITSLETYLSDAFINTVTKNQEYIRKFVKTFKDFNNYKIEYSSIFEEFEAIKEKVTKTLLDVIYHNIGKVKGMYKDTLGVELPKDLTILGKAIGIRHDIVHRNGKDKNGNIRELTIDDINTLISHVKNFVKQIDDQLKNSN